MPGRSGRSKGCINCRARKLGCDQKRPSCGRCLKLKEVCEGYETPDFIAFNPIRQTLRDTSKDVVVSDSNRSDTIAITSSHQQVPIRDHRIFNIPNKPSILPISEDIFITYTRCTMLKENGGHYKVLDRVDVADSSNKLYRNAITALGTTFFGLRQGRTDLVQKGSHYYVASLTEINNHLRTAGKFASADLLSAIICLGTLERMRPTSTTGWVHHFNGLAGLFRSWGSNACAVDPIRALLRHCRPVMIMASMRISEPSFLAETEWKDICCDDVLGTRLPVEYIFDILADLSRHVCSQRAVGAIRHADTVGHVRRTMILDLILDVRKSLTALENWETMFGTMHDSNKVEIPCIPFREDFDRPDLAWSKIYNYTTLSFANTICFQHATRIKLLLILLTYLTELQEEERRPEILSELRTSAIEIGKSVDYHLFNKQASAGGLFLMFPLQTAMFAFEKLEMWTEVNWTISIFDYISTTKKSMWKFALSVAKHK